MQPTVDERKKYLEKQLLCLQANGHVVDLQINKTPNKAAVERGSLVVADASIIMNGSILQIHVGLDEYFPQSLPIILLKAGSVSGYIPHVEPDGFVCYSAKENLVLNNIVPERILGEAIERTKDVLEDGISGKNKWDLIDEFDAYWRAYQTVSPIKSLINPTEYARKIVVAQSGDKTNGIGINYISDTDSTAIDFGVEAKTVTHENGIYIPLLPGTFIDLFAKETLTVKDIQKIITGNISHHNRKLLKKLAKRHKRNEVVIFRLPRPSGGEVLFGVLFVGVRADHPLNEQGQAEKIIPLALQRLDKSYLLPRGGANSLLQDKKVALIGCGAVGGYIAIQLAQSGVFNLTLIDPDVMKPENIFRHILGKDYLGKSKVDALKIELENKFPYTRIKSFSLKIEDAISKSLFDLDKFDLIIMATGDDNLSLNINRVLYGERIKPPILYSWLEPYGIGGHVLITNLENKGCFQCLFTPLQEDDEFSNRASFVAAGQTFTKDISGCANRFTPFNALDASNTASLAVRIAIKILTGTINTNMLFSWRGEADVLIGEGYQASDRYNNFDTTTINKGINVHSLFCQICSG